MIQNRRTEWAGLAALALLGLGVHRWFAAGADALDSDRALVLLMARHFAQGEFSIFFWQQNYMAAVEPLLLTPLALFGLATPVAASVVAIALTAALCALSVSLTRRLGGSPWMTLLLWALPPAVVVHHHVSLYGARLVATCIAVGAFALALRANSRRSWMTAGALAGFAYFSDHLMLAWAAAAIYVMAQRGGLRYFALGALPIVALDTIAAVMTPAFHLAGPNDPGSWLANVPLLFGTAIPQLFGLLLGRAPGPLFETPPSLVPAGVLWLVLVVPAAVVLCALFVTLIGHRRKLARAGVAVADSAAASGDAVRGLLVACAATGALFVFAGGGGDKWSVRYLVPLWPALSVLAALGVAQWRPRVRIAGALVALPALFTLFADRNWPRGSDDSAAARDEAATVQQAVRESGAVAVWTDYWDTYRMALLAGESPRWVTLRIIERRPDWVREANSTGPVAYLLRGADREMLGRLADAASRGLVHTISTRDVGRYRLVVTDRTAPQMVAMNDPPSVPWQRLAALAGGLAFLAALAGGWALARLTSGSRASVGPADSNASPG